MRQDFESNVHEQTPLKKFMSVQIIRDQPSQNNLAQELFAATESNVNKNRQDFTQNLSYYNDQSFMDGKQSNSHLKSSKWNCNISPESNFLLFWNIVILIAIIGKNIQIPIAYFIIIPSNTQINQPVLKFTMICSLIALFFVDMFIRPNITIYQKGKYIKDKKQLLIRYLSYYFFVDFVTWLTLFLQFFQNNLIIYYGKFLFCLKLFTIKDIDKAIRSRLQFNMLYQSAYLLLRNLLFIYVILNWFACIYFSIDYSFYVKKQDYYWSNKLWLNGSNITNNQDLIKFYQWYVWYLYAFYLIIQTSSGIGYGDITPLNPQQVLFCCITIICTTIVFSFFVKSVWQIFNDIFQSDNTFYRKYDYLERFIKKNNLPRQLTQKLELFYIEYWRKQQYQKNCKQQIICMLSQQLIQSFQQQAFSHLLSLPIFSQLSLISPNNWRTLLITIYPIINQSTVPIDHIIYESIKKPKLRLYYLIKGKIQLYLYQYFIKEINSSNFFGIERLFYDISAYSAKAKVISKFSYFEWTTFVDALKSQRNIFQKFCELREDLIFGFKMQLINNKCDICNAETHFTHKCFPLKEQLFQIKHEIQTVHQEQARNVKHRGYKKGKKILIAGILDSWNIDQVRKLSNYRNYFNL